MRLHDEGDNVLAKNGPQVNKQKSENPPRKRTTATQEVGPSGKGIQRVQGSSILHVNPSTPLVHWNYFAPNPLQVAPEEPHRSRWRPLADEAYQAVMKQALRGHSLVVTCANTHLSSALHSGVSPKRPSSTVAGKLAPPAGCRARCSAAAKGANERGGPKLLCSCHG